MGPTWSDLIRDSWNQLGLILPGIPGFIFLFWPGFLGPTWFYFVLQSWKFSRCPGRAHFLSKPSRKPRTKGLNNKYTENCFFGEVGTVCLFILLKTNKKFLFFCISVFLSLVKCKTLIPELPAICKELWTFCQYRTQPSHSSNSGIYKIKQIFKL